MNENSTVFVTEQNNAVILCPQCKKLKMISVEKFREEKHTLNIRCSCGNQFQINLNFRRGTRKKTNLEGTYRKSSANKSSTKICRIANISFQGICIKIYAENDLSIGDEIIIHFHLDNQQHTEIERKVKVVNLFQEDHIGGVFIDQESDNLDKHIAFFMMN